MKHLILLGAIAMTTTLFGQLNFFSPASNHTQYNDDHYIKTSKEVRFDVDLMGMQAYLDATPYREDQDIQQSTFMIKLPHPDGTMHRYKVLRNQTMSPGYNAKFPEIRTYDAVDADNPYDFVKFDITPAGFHGMIRGVGHPTYYIDPVHPSAPNTVKVYSRDNFITNKMMDCGVTGSKKASTSVPMKQYGTCELRTYRLAVAATGEYTSFHGGQQSQAVAAQVTTINRMNSVYEVDMAITFTIVPNNSNIVYTNTTTDPYTNGQTNLMIQEVQTDCDNNIGSGNYDIGHVFGTNSGGLAGLGVVCVNGQKARGVTGSGAPVGDPFDIDYVCHEVGHQFGANHTQNNNCNRNNATAVEPGSASTIMGYAGICSPNVQNNSDDHFHGISLSEISAEIQSGGHQCETLSTLSNNAPVITGTNGNVSVPAQTPFALTCAATDADNDPLTYNWEQMDNEISTQPPSSSSTSGPNFRSFSSSASPTRYFPNLNSLANNGSYTWEVLPSVTRSMDFRCSVRDNAAGGGCADFVDVTVTTVATAGPFIVTYPTANGITWTGLTTETVTWSVANTDQSPISASHVDIYLSTDGGQSYPTLVLANTPNDGSQAVTVPNLPTSTARIMVISSQGTFFDVSNANFTITGATNDYNISLTPSSVSECEGTNATFTVNSTSVGSYSDPITLSVPSVPGGGSANFSVNPITPGQSSVLTLSGVSAGTYAVDVQGSSTSGTKTVSGQLTITTSNPGTVTLTTPSAGATNVSNPVDFAWTASGTGVTYDIDIATDNGFANIVENATGLTATNYTSGQLNMLQTYYWRVRAVNSCNQSAYETASFTTDGCQTYMSTDVPKTIPTTISTITSTLTIPTAGTIVDVNVVDLEGDHSWINDLTFTVISPTATEVILFDGICNDQDNFDVNFDDAATVSTLPCPPTTGLTYQPQGTLSSFNNEQVNGTWTLRVEDGANQDGGTLTSWGLEVCLTGVNPCNNPTQPTLSGPATACEGEQITLTIASGTLNDATEWTWYEGSCGGTAIGTGTSIQVSPTATTTYYAKGTGGCVINSNCGSHAVTVTTVDESIGVSGNVATANQNNAIYQWLDCDNGMSEIQGETGQTYTASQAGNVACVVTFNGCADTSACTPIDGPCIDPDVPVVNGPTSMCADDEITLTVASGNLNDATQWEWYTGSCGSTPIGTGTSITVSPGGNTTYFVRGVGGCVQNANCGSQAVTVTNINTSVTESGTTLTAVASNVGYQWLDCDNGFAIIQGETQQSFTATAIVGEYAVELTVGNCVDTSICYLIDQNNLGEITSEHFVLFPNPTDGQITITGDELQTYSTWTITDARGRVLKAGEVNNHEKVEIKVNEFSRGVYFVSLRKEGDVETIRFIKK